MNHKKYLAVFGAALFIILSISSCGQSERGMRGKAQSKAAAPKKIGNMAQLNQSAIPRGLQKINLSQEQKQSIKKLRLSTDSKKLQKLLKTESAKLNKLLRNLNSSEEELLVQADRVNKVQSELLLTRVKMAQIFRSTLTKEQIAKLQEIKRDKQKKRI